MSSPGIGTHVLVKISFKKVTYLETLLVSFTNECMNLRGHCIYGHAVILVSSIHATHERVKTLSSPCICRIEILLTGKNTVIYCLLTTVLNDRS